MNWLIFESPKRLFKYFHVVTNPKLKRMTEQEVELQEFFDNVKNVLFKIKVEPGDDIRKYRYRYLMINHTFCHRIGKSKNEIVGKSIDEILPAAALDETYARYQEAIDSGKRFSWEMTMDFKPGQITGTVTITPHFDQNGRCEYIIGYVFDLTAVTRAQYQLRREEMLSKAFFDDSFDPILVFDNSGKCIKYNKASEEVFGYSESEMAGMDFIKLLPRDEQLTFNFSELEKKQMFSKEIHLLTKTNEPLSFYYRISDLISEMVVVTLSKVTVKSRA
jgi:PAS domain S-box-containing protein